MNSSQLQSIRANRVVAQNQRQQNQRRIPEQSARKTLTFEQTFDEISVTERVLRRKSPCNFLVFGLGYDSLMWASLNHGGRTVFLEEDDAWIRQITLKFPTLKSHHVVYDTKVRNSDDLLSTARAGEECHVVADPRESKCVLALKGLPEEVYEIE